MSGSADRITVEGLSGLAAAVRSLNDAVSELVCGLASGEPVSKGWAYVVVETLAAHTRTLGGAPLIDVGNISHWQP